MRRVKLDDSRASRTIWHLHQQSCAGSPTHALRHALMCHACSKSAPFYPTRSHFSSFSVFSLKTSFLIIKTYDISVSLMMPSAGRVLSPGRTKIRPKWVEVIRFGQVDLTRFVVPGWLGWTGPQPGHNRPWKRSSRSVWLGLVHPSKWVGLGFIW